MNSLPAMPSPDSHPVWPQYQTLRREGNLLAAAETLKSLLTREPRTDWAYNELTELLLIMRRHGDADTLARTALRVNPLNAQAHNLFGTVLSEQNDLPAGEWHFRRALELAGEQPMFLANLALNLMKQGRTDEAEGYFSRADAREPANLKTLAHWSKLYEVTGDMPRAWELLEQAAAASPGSDINLLRANHLSRAGKPAEALAILDSAPKLTGDARLERGRLLDRMGRYDEAWNDLVAGKQLLAAEAGGLTYNAQAVEAFFARLKRFFVAPTIRDLPTASVRTDVPQPVFIVGFPRSGTTLIEQVLTSHSDVRAGGELSFLGELRQFSLAQFPGPESFPDNLARVCAADRRWAATIFRDYYFARAEQYGLNRPGPASAARIAGISAVDGGHKFFTDKMPFNEIWLPLLRMAFPEARVVRVVRHPLDVCVSMLSHNMTHGFNCGYRIEDIVHHLLAVADLDAHYARERSALDVGVELNRELILSYESFIADQQGETRRLLDFLGLPFEEACLSFHQNRRYAPTPSYAQVTERLNDRSIGRHRHYTRQLAPFIPQLHSLLTARGYDQNFSRTPA
jgi:tetratricopeptide (TPR) repeat protein